MIEDKLQKRYEILDKLIELLSHGEAKIKWADKTITVVEDIETESKITK
jgi:hypothetical protein